MIRVEASSDSRCSSHRATALGVLLAIGCVAVLAVACGSSGDSSTFVPPEVDASGSSSGAFGDFNGNGDAGTSPATGHVSACGNGVKNPDTEICDDGNTSNGDGCGSNCRVEPGYLCPTAGAPCVAIKCGDGIAAGQEDCDDGNTTDDDGCSAKCTVEKGFKCAPAGSPCVQTKCGDNQKEGVEQCDDGNLVPFDGCDPACNVEPICAGGTCTAVCGDGLKFTNEACDDGNVRDGDGCSSTCKLEMGFTCANAKAAPTTTKTPWIVYRDFKARGSMLDGHPDFFNLSVDQDGNTNGKPLFQDNAINQIATGLVTSTLNPAGKPVFASQQGSGTLKIIRDAASFAAWYTDTPYSKKVVSTLTLTNDGSNNYVFDTTAFFPLDGKASAWTDDTTANSQVDNGGAKHNFLFTSELRIPFQYKGGENLTFRGDDDVWVFINGKLAVDLGGVKEAQSGAVSLDAAAATKFGLAIDGMYEFVVFQAERNPTGSNYRLTLNDFDRIITTCKSVCGDGVKTPDEVCDDGTANNTGAYGHCSADCTARGPFCGDGIVQSDKGEQCDSAPGCTADCRTAANGPH